MQAKAGKAPGPRRTHVRRRSRRPQPNAGMRRTRDAKMPTTGLEPVRRFRHRSLKPACLPNSSTWANHKSAVGGRQVKRCSGRDSNPHGVYTPQGPEPCASTNSATRAKPTVDGAEGNRTPDLLNAIQALSQLSYSPNALVRPEFSNSFPAGLTGLEPATSGVTDRHSNQTELQPLPYMY